ncbi:MAG TPA: hypothetical protein VGV65_12715 [Nocardioides sp.]|nr:hypothetical protein [Nocardioides sp.]
MKTHVRAASIAMAGAGFVAAMLTAGPALAAGPVLNLTDCQAGGGTFTLVKSLKTCTTKTVVAEPAPYDYVDENSSNFGSDSETTYVATFDLRREGHYEYATTQTQKGKGPIKLSVSNVYGVEDRVTVLLDGRECDRLDMVTGVYESVDTSVCEGLGLYTR